MAKSKSKQQEEPISAPEPVPQVEKPSRAPRKSAKSEKPKAAESAPKVEKEAKKEGTKKEAKKSSRKRAAAEPEVETETESKPEVETVKAPKKPKTKKSFYETVSEDEAWSEWKGIYFAGTEWENYDRIFDYPWTFEHVWKYLSEREKGTDDGSKLFVFGVTEPQFCKVNGADQVVLIPALVVAETKAPPPESIALKSVQLVEEIMVPFSRLKLTWHQISGTEIHVLKCGARKQMIERMPIERRNEFTYALPYMLRKKDIDEMGGQDTSVQVQVEREGNPPLLFDHDWEMDTIADRANEICEDSGITDATEIENVKQAIKAAVKAKKEANAKEVEKVRARYEAFTDAQKEAFETMRVTKWYPENKEPEIDQWKTPFINRYWGRASQVF